MRKLGKSQIGLLRLLSKRYSLIGGKHVPAGLSKSSMLSSDWRVVDRLTELGLVEMRFVRGEGNTYFITDHGRDSLSPAERD